MSRFLFCGAVTLVMAASGCVDETEQALPGINLPGDMSADGFFEPEPIECPGDGPRLVRGNPATWTIIHYAAGDNDLQESILRDINEMELGHQGSPNVNIVVQLDRRDEDGVWRYQIADDNTANDPDRNTIISPLVGYSPREPDSGDYHTLIEFGRWAAYCYPAENYIMVIGGHGRGWSQSDGEGMAGREVEFDAARQARALEHGDTLRFIAPDDTNGSEIFVDQLVESLGSIREITRRDGDIEETNRLLAYGSDACLMGTIEVAYDLRQAVRFVIGSEQIEPEEGWPYSTMIRDLTNRPGYFSRNPELLMQSFVQAYGRSYNPHGSSGLVRTNTTLSALNARSVDAFVEDIGSIARLLTQLLMADEQNNNALLNTIMIARQGSPTFGHTYTDLGQFLYNLYAELLENELIPQQGQPWDRDPRYAELAELFPQVLYDRWPELVVASHAGSDYPHAMGLSVYLPEESCNDRLPMDVYAASAFAENTDWDNLVRTIIYQDINEAHGSGAVEVTQDAQSFSDLGAECHIGDNRLFVNVDDNANDGPSVSLALDPVGMGLTVVNAEIDLRSHGGERLRVRNVSIEVNDVLVEKGMTYGGRVTVPFEDSTGTNVPVDFDFVCQGFTLSC